MSRIPNSLFHVLGGRQSQCRSTILKGFLPEFRAEIHLRRADRVGLEWEKAVDLVHDGLGVMVDHQKVINITEDKGVVPDCFPVCLFLEPQVRISRARHIAHSSHASCQMCPKGGTT